ncbi:hypothetical protein M2146_002514 [Lachnospiraceae bacterium PF1-22]
MKKIKYDPSRPLMRLETGDKAIIKYSKSEIENQKDSLKYKDVPSGRYEAIVIAPYRLECKEHPVLSGSYNYWRGDKWGTSALIYADEVKD